MGKKHSKLFQYSAINIPVKCNLTFINFKKYNNIIYLYFKPTKKIISPVIQLEFKQTHKPLEIFNIVLNKNKAKYIIINTLGLIEYDHTITENNKSENQRKIIIRTDIDHKIISIVYVLPIIHLS